MEPVDAWFMTDMVARIGHNGSFGAVTGRSAFGQDMQTSRRSASDPMSDVEIVSLFLGSGLDDYANHSCYTAFDRPATWQIVLAPIADCIRRSQIMSRLHVVATAGQDRATASQKRKRQLPDPEGVRRSPRCHPVIVPLRSGAIARSDRGGAPSPFPRTRCAPSEQDRACCRRPSSPRRRVRRWSRCGRARPCRPCRRR